MSQLEQPDGRVVFHQGPHHGKLSHTATRPWIGLWHAATTVPAMRRLATRHEAHFVALLGAYPGILRLLRQCWTDPAAPRLDIVLHGGLAEVVGWRSRNPLLRHFDRRAEFSRPIGQAVRFVALEEPIATNLVAACPARAADTVVLPHPVPVAELSDAIPPAPDPMQLGFLGNTTAAKGFPAFLELARALPEFRYHALGALAAPLPPQAAALLATAPGDTLPREAYLAGLRALHLAILPFTGSEYEWTASGSLIDCLTNLLPFVATRTGLTAALAERFGPMGLLVDQPSELAGALVGKDAAWYAAHAPGFRDSLRQARAARMPATLAAHYPRRG